MPGQSFRIIIPGSVDPNRRNYSDIIKTLSIFPSTRPLELVLLGDAGAEAAASIIAEFQPLLSDRISLRTFKGYIPESTYEHELAHAHLIWSPLNIHKKSSRNSPEI